MTGKNPSLRHLLIALPWVIFIAYFANQWRLDRATAGRQQTTYGTITAHEPANHDRYGFTFSVGGRTYRGWEIPKKKEYNIGEQVVVYYDPIDPSRSALTDFNETSLSLSGFIVCLVLATGALVFIVIYLRHRNLATPNQQSFGA